MDKWEKRERRLTWWSHVQSYLKWLDFGWLYQKDRKHRFIGNFFILSGVAFTVINVVSLANYGLWWLFFG